jgi:hypothetical protein
LNVKKPSSEGFFVSAWVDYLKAAL